MATGRVEGRKSVVSRRLRKSSLQGRFSNNEQPVVTVSLAVVHFVDPRCRTVRLGVCLKCARRFTEVSNQRGLLEERGGSCRTGFLFRDSKSVYTRVKRCFDGE
ncbi:uncharacterized protein LOC143186706 [Calliopsis andreniformis]|uniref:uncharacterized protein LOC143186706 n=1 Tax=Calliopsis andreniformis TaxID=337506 RepID=UPI003FCCD3BF